MSALWARVCTVACAAWLAGSAGEEPYAAEPPAGLERRVNAPADSPDTPERHALGAELFRATLLSHDRSLSCAACHRPEHGFADVEPTSLGVGGARTERNAPSLFNRGFGRAFTWDGRFTTLEEQVLAPIEHPREMGLSIDEALARLAADAGWRAGFERAFGGGPTRERLALALATFVRRRFLGDSPVDRFRAGQFDALSEEERVGLWTYESRGRCWQCHGGANFTDEDFHNTGVGSSAGVAEPGRMAVTGQPADRGAFKTPSLRGVAQSAPYFHDGSAASLAEVVAHYRRGGNPNAQLDPRIEPLEISDREAAGLVAFLEALSRGQSAAQSSPNAR